LQNGVDSASYFLEQDALQIHTLKLLSGVNLRGKVVADVGCGGGSLLDHLSGVAAKKIAIEPYDVYRKDLKQRGYSSFAYAAQAVQGHEGKVDLAFSMQVIEHVNNPRTFLEEIKPLLKKDGELWISTPNRDDILGDLLPDDYLSFFYRVVHRWYFDAESLAKCANEAGFDVKSVHYVHRYSMANLLRWLRDRKPTGNTHIEGLDETVDAFWKVYLEKTGKSDCLYMVLSPSVK
jgi:2-polyprenyl-3-methyl-5-hydroxy-6-metoxy-1,4-benzoquinol methylase